MIYYFLVSLIIVFVLDLVGRAVLAYLKIDNILPFAAGLITFLAYSYITTSILSALHCSFYIILVIYALFFIFFITYIIVERKKIDFNIKITDYIIMVVFNIIMLLYAYNTSLGDPNGFDSTFYLNLVTSNIKSPTLNTTINAYGNTYSTIGNMYIYQTYYLVASVFTYIITAIINLFHQTYYPTVYIWVFQNIFNMFFCSLILSSFRTLKQNKKYILFISFFVLFIFFYGRLYYINVYGFYGNTYRWITTGYTTLILNELLSDPNNDKKWILFFISLLASASVSSSSIFIDILIMFSAFFILIKKEKNTIKKYCSTLMILLTNLFSITLSFNVFICLILSFVICLLLYFLNDYIYKVFSINRVQFITIFSITILMFILSYLTTNNIFNFNAFFSNLSENNDMTINYFNIFSFLNFTYLKTFVLALFIINVIFNSQNNLMKIYILLFICLLNPFCCPYLNKLNVVYYRVFDFYFNPFTFIFMVFLILKRFDNKYLYYILCVFMLLLMFNSNVFQPAYYHSSFRPGYNYDFERKTDYIPEYKLTQDEIEVIDIIIKDSAYNNISNPYIISPIIFTQSFIPQGRFMYYREYYVKCNFTSNNERQLFSIFYPQRYKGDKAENINPDYYSIKENLEISGIDYLVVDKKKEYFDSRKGDYSYLSYLVLEDMYPIYENDCYLVINCQNS